MVCGDLRAHDNVVFHGTVRVYGTVVFGQNVTVRGNLICEKEISIDDNGQVLGNIFGQDTIFLGKNCRVGQRDKTKSIVGKKGVTLSPGVIMYGLILTEGKGTVL